jgi:predicted acyltransferase
LLSSMAAVVTCLLGVFAGAWLRVEGVTPRKRVLNLLFAGLLLVAAGWGGSSFCPIIKKIWTPTFVLVAGGYSALLLTFFYGIIDLCGWRSWAKPFVWIGTNSILVYLSVSIIRYQDQAARLVGGDIRAGLNAWHAGAGDLLLALVAVLLLLALCRYLYQRKIFLRV